jgi:hypothetical protein
MLQVCTTLWAEVMIRRDHRVTPTLKTGDCLHNIGQNSLQQRVTWGRLLRISAGIKDEQMR